MERACKVMQTPGDERGQSQSQGGGLRRRSDCLDRAQTSTTHTCRKLVYWAANRVSCSHRLKVLVFQTLLFHPFLPLLFSALFHPALLFSLFLVFLLSIAHSSPLLRFPLPSVYISPLSLSVLFLSLLLPF